MGYKRWTDEEERYLRNNIEDMNNKEIAKVLGRTSESVKKKIQIMDIKRSDEAVQKMISRAAEKSNKQRDLSGSNNPNWKGGVSDNPYRYKKRQKRKHPKKVKCREKTRQLIKSGELQRQDCESCGKSKKEEKIHAHHEDYDKPRQVTWLCRSCHRQVHDGKH